VERGITIEKTKEDYFLKIKELSEKNIKNGQAV